MSELNVQNQQKIVWPKNKSAALAYIDQLERSQALTSDEIANLRRAVEAKRMDQGEIARLKEMLEKNAVNAKSKADKSRLHALAEILNRPEA